MSNATPGHVIELKRIQRVSDQLTTMHATLRDIYRARALYLDALLLAGSIVICTLALADSHALRILRASPAEARVYLAVSSAILFFGLLIAARFDWKGKAADHARASQAYASIKLKARELLAKDEPNSGTLASELFAQYSLIGQTCIPIPDGRFVSLKAVHKRKVFLSQCLDDNPCASVRLLSIAMWWRHTWDSLRHLRRTQTHATEENGPDDEEPN